MKAPAKAKLARAARGQTKPPLAARSAKRAEKGRAWRGWLFVLLLVTLALAIYAPSLSGPFILDDYDIQEAYSAVRTGEPTLVLNSGRPLLLLTYVLNHRLGGFEPFPFHLTNVLLHAVNALILWRFMAALFAAGRLDEMVGSRFRPLFVYGVPLLFLASPLQTESVAYISSRSEVLAGTFYLAALWVFASPLRERRPWVTALVVMLLFAGSVSSKQDKLSLPFVILLLDYLLLARLDWRKLRVSWPTYGLFLLGIIVGFFVVVKPILFSPTVGFNLPWKTYLFTQFRMHFLYLRLVLVPFGLNADYDIVASESLWQHLSWLALLGLSALVAVVTWHHRRYPVIAFGALFFLIALAPTSSFFPILDYAAERRLYLPMIGLLLAGLEGLNLLLRPSKRAAAMALGAVLAVYSVGTYQRSEIWSDELTLWQDTVEKSPHKYRAWTWLGLAHNGRGNFVQAVQAWQKADQLVEAGSSDHAFILSNLGLAHANLNNRAEAVRYYQRALEIRPENAMFWANLAVSQMRMGRKKEAWESFAKAANFGPQEPGVFRLRGQELFQAGRYAEAAADFRRALEMRPEDDVVRKNLAATEAMLQQMQRRKQSETREQD